MAFTRPYKTRLGDVAEAYHAITEFRVTDRWSALQRNQEPSQRPDKYGVHVFVDVWESEEARKRGDLPIGRSAQQIRVAIDPKIPVVDAFFQYIYGLVEADIDSRRPNEERRRQRKERDDLTADFQKAVETSRVIILHGAEKTIVPSDLSRIAAAVAKAEGEGKADVTFFDGSIETLSVDDINGVFRQMAGEPVAAPVASLDAALEQAAVSNPELFGGAPDDPLGPLEALKAKIDAVRAGTQELTPDELISMHRDDPPGAAAKLEDAIRALKGDARRKLSELLNVELAELKNLRGMAGEDREREQQIEYLLGLFTRLGEI